LERLAVLTVRDDHVIHTFFQGNAARHCCAVRSFGNDPGSARFDFDFPQQHREPDAAPLTARRESVGPLHALFFRFRPLSKAVAGTLHEMETRHRGEPSEFLHGQDQRLFHQAMDEKTVLSWIDVRDPRVMPLVVEGRRGDDAMQIL
jgi:hypothetical protein